MPGTPGGMDNAREHWCNRIPSRPRVFHPASDGTKRRPHAPQAQSLYSSNTTSRVGLVHPLRNRWEETDRPTSLRSDERSRSPESVFTITGSGVQLHRNAHKDHDHDNNPPDGSNWELLCLYCHDNEHERHQVADAYGPLSPGEEHPTSTYKPFAGLADVLKRNT